MQKELPLRYDSALEYIDGYDYLMWEFLDERVRSEDQERAVATLRHEPVTFANMLKNNDEISSSDRKDSAISLVSTSGNVTVMIGAKRWGKTGTAFWVIEELISRGVTVFWYGYSPTIAKLYPQIIQTFDIKRVKNGVLIVDEAAVFSSARNAMTTEQKEKVAQIFTCGHSDWSVIYISQTFRIDITILNTMDVLWFKPFFQMDFDREQARNKFSDTYEYMRPVYKDENLVINCQENNAWFFTNELPKLWCDALSKPFSRLETRDEAVKYLKLLTEAGMTKREIKTWVSQRGWDAEELVEDAISSAKGEQKARVLEEMGLKDTPICSACQSIRITGKGFRNGRKRLECLDCGHSGYEETFKPGYVPEKPEPKAPLIEIFQEAPRKREKKEKPFKPPNIMPP